MTYGSRLLRKESKELAPDQKAVLEAYLSPGGRVCVDAGAGTGKTTTLIETMAEVILDELEKNPASNPMRSILAVSFGVEASRQLKTALKKRLRDHVDAGGELPSLIWRYIECESHIQTIDAFMQALLREIALNLGISPAFEIPSGLEQDALVQEVFDNILHDPTNAEKWHRLERAYPSLDYLDPPPENLQTMVWRSHQKSREICMEIRQAHQSLVNSVTNIIHCNKSPPFTMKDLEEIVRNLSGGNYSLTCPKESEKAIIEHAQDVYQTSLQLAKDFADILSAFDRQYTKLTKERGWLTYVDIAYLVWQYTYTGRDKDWTTSLQGRFDHILIDEFQDTSHVQFEVLKSLFRAGSPQLRNRIMLIGDVKQSIYQWRSAEPEIFADIINGLKTKPEAVDPSLEGIVYRPLTSNFRSHPQLIHLYNGIFSNLFSDASRGAVLYEVKYSALDERVKDLNGDSPKIHVLHNDEGTVGGWVHEEAPRIAEIVRGILDQTSSNVKVQEGNRLRPAQAGDIALLFRRNRNIPSYVEKLRAAGVNCAIQTDVSLFSESEVSIIIDFLDWLANPESRDSITRILRSPLVALSDTTLRYLASEGFLLIRALQEWNLTLGLPEEDKARLEDLIKLRNDLRWDREGAKAALIERIIASGCFDSVVLASEDGVQSQANLWMLIEVVSSWEEEELLPYREFVEILKQLRERALEGNERDYPRAIMADEKTKDAVKIMTTHAAKGLEFPIVIIPESMVFVQENNRGDRMARNRKIGLILKPRAGQTYLPSQVMIVQRGQNRGIAWASRGNEESILWLSPIRDSSNGMFIARTPINQIVSEALAEFWRILYVAATRARDHLIFSCGDKWARYEWNSWMRFLRTAMNLGNMQTSGIQKIVFTWEDVKGKTITKEVNLGIEDLPSLLLPQPSPISRQIYPTGKEADYETGCPSFVPSVINPSTFPTLLECPRRYQYETLWKTSGLRAPPKATGSSPPAGLSAEEWGKTVHEAFEHRDYAKELDSDSRLLKYLDSQRPEVRIELEKVLRHFSELDVGKLVAETAKKGGCFIPERSVEALLTAIQPPLLVEGRFDLLFQLTNGDWILVDFKAEEEPSVGSYRDRIHRNQINAYAWLIERAIGIKVKSTFLAYVHPIASQREHTPDVYGFESNAVRKLKSLLVEEEHGLEAIPSQGTKGICPVCPYSKSVGGPCEH